MKKLIIIIVTLTLLVFISCGEKIVEQPPNKPSDKPTETTECKRTIWVNPDVECCDVKDPLNNLEWLRKTSKFDEYNTAPASDYNFIFLFKNKDTQKDYIVVNYYCCTSWVFIYDCIGNFIDGGGYSILERNKIEEGEFTAEEPPAPCNTCDEFFNTHTLIDTIAYSIVYF